MPIQSPPKPLSPEEWVALAHKKPQVLSAGNESLCNKDYPPWDTLRHLPPPEGLSSKEYWHAVRCARDRVGIPLPFYGKGKTASRYTLTSSMQESLHWLDMVNGGEMNPASNALFAKDKTPYMIRSLVEEAITSSQLEGASTTRLAAKKMLREKREPRTVDERMILNNYHVMEIISQNREKPMTKEFNLDINRLILEETQEEESVPGRFRTAMDDVCVVNNATGEVVHVPPPAEELEARCEAMCKFANGETPDMFIHPVVRAIVLHFWMGYDHPFGDGNGRVARALFYWAMLRYGYPVFEYISISSILRKRHGQYAHAYLYTESDQNDLTYFILMHLDVIRDAVRQLDRYLARRVKATEEIRKLIRSGHGFNPRQRTLLEHALLHPKAIYDTYEHMGYHGVVYQTARTDLLGLAEKGLLNLSKRGRMMIFEVPSDLDGRVKAATLGSPAVQ